MKLMSKEILKYFRKLKMDYQVITKRSKILKLLFKKLMFLFFVIICYKGYLKN